MDTTMNSKLQRVHTACGIETGVQIHLQECRMLWLQRVHTACGIETKEYKDTVACENLSCNAYIPLAVLKQ